MIHFLQQTQILQRAQAGAASALSRDMIALVGAYWALADLNIFTVVGAYRTHERRNAEREYMITDGRKVVWYEPYHRSSALSITRCIFEDHLGLQWGATEEDYKINFVNGSGLEEARIVIDVDVKYNHFLCCSFGDKSRVAIVVTHYVDRIGDVYVFDMKSRVLTKEISECRIQVTESGHMVDIGNNHILVCGINARVSEELYGVIDLSSHTPKLPKLTEGDERIENALRLRDGSIFMLVVDYFSAVPPKLFQAVIWHPFTTKKLKRVFIHDHSIVYSGLALLSDGRVIISGGQIFTGAVQKKLDSTMTFIYDPFYGTVKRASDLPSSVRHHMLFPYVPQDANRFIWNNIFLYSGSVPLSHHCARCATAGCKRMCARCKKAYYCNVGCQTQHWPEHKTRCNSFN